MPLIKVHEFDESLRVFYPMLINTARIAQVRGLDTPGCRFDEYYAASLRQGQCNSAIFLIDSGKLVIAESIDHIEQLVEDTIRPDRNSGVAQFMRLQRMKIQGENK